MPVIQSPNVYERPLQPDVSFNRYLNKDNGNGNAGPYAWFSNLVGSMFGSYKNWANTELSKYQTDYDLWQQNYQNYYNSPEQTMQRYMAAGINPNMIASGVSGGQSAASSAAVPEIQDVGQTANGKLAQVLSMVSGLVGLSQAMEALKGQKIANQIAGYNATIKSAEAAFANDYNLFRWQSGATKYLLDTYQAGWLPKSGYLLGGKPIGDPDNIPVISRYNLEGNAIQALRAMRSASAGYTGSRTTQQRIINNHLEPIMRAQEENWRKRNTLLDTQDTLLNRQLSWFNTNQFMSMLKIFGSVVGNFMR